MLVDGRGMVVGNDDGVWKTLAGAKGSGQGQCVGIKRSPVT